MGITRSQYLAGNNANGVVLPGQPQAVTAGFGVSIDSAGVISVTPGVLPQAQIVNLGVLEAINGVNTVFTLCEYGTTVPFTLAANANIAVFLGGIPQLPGSSYTVSSSQVTFTEAPPTGATFIAITIKEL